MRLLVTGAAGCVGRAVIQRCLAAGDEVRAVARSGEYVSTGRVEWVRANLLAANLDELVLGCDGVVHLAALVHRAENENPEDYEAMNVGLTAALLRAARQSGIDPQRCVVASSTAVYGATSQIVSEEAPCFPVTLYGKSKLAAEHVTLEQGGIVVRLPLVYGLGDRGNFARLVHTIARGRFAIPIPDGPRSLISSDNAAEAIYCCLRGSGAEGVFLASDQRDVTLSEIVSWVRAGLGKPRYIPRVPAELLKFAAQLGTAAKRFGISVPLTRERYDALTRGLCVDTARITRRLGYRPVQSPELAIQELVRSMFSSEQR